MTGRESNLSRLQELVVVVSVAALAILTTVAGLPAPVDSLDVAVEDVQTAIGLARLEALRGRSPARVELDHHGNSLIVRRSGVADVLHRLHLAPAIRASPTFGSPANDGWRLEFDRRGSPVGPRLGLTLRVDRLEARIEVDALGRIGVLTRT